MRYKREQWNGKIIIRKKENCSLSALRASVRPPHPRRSRASKGETIRCVAHPTTEFVPASGSSEGTENFCKWGCCEQAYRRNDIGTTRRRRKIE